MTTNQLLTIKETAKMLRLSTYTIYAYVRKGYLDVVRLPSGVLRVKRECVERILGVKTATKG